jgi:tetratricopeptide (TPR) repeat protein
MARAGVNAREDRGVTTGGRKGWRARRAWFLRIYGLSFVLLKRRDLLAAHRASIDRRWEEAAQFYESVLRTAPRADGVRIQLGHMYKEMGRLDRAAAEYYDVLSRRPRDDDLHLQIGHLEKRRRDWRAALTHYEEAARLNPANADAVDEYSALGGDLERDDRDLATTVDGQLPPITQEVRAIYIALLAARGEVV